MQFPIEFLIFLVGILASFIGSIAAGSGIIIVSALLFFGIPPHIALGTSNFGDVGSKIGNILRFSRSKNMGVLRRDVIILTIICVPSTIIGSLIVVSINEDVLSKLIGIILLVIFPLLFINRNLGLKENRAIGKKRIISHVAYFFASAWSGFFSPGAGFLETYIRIRGYGYTILQGKAVTRIPLLISGIGSVLVFVFSDLINYKYAIVLFLGMIIGGYIGTAFAIKKGDAWLKPLLGIIILGTAIKMIFY